MKEQKKVNPLATESEGKLIAKFAIPAIISMLVSSLYNIVDQIFIGQGVGLLGNAATNIAFPVSIICTIIQSNIRKEQISPKTSSFRGFLYIPINLSDTTKTHEISTVTNT